MMGKHPTPPQKVNENSAGCICTDDWLVGVNYSGPSDRDVTPAAGAQCTGKVMAVQTGPS